MVDSFAAPDLDAATAAFLQAERDLVAAKQDVLTHLEQELATAPPERRRLFSRSIKRIRSGMSSDAGDPLVDRAAQTVHRATRILTDRSREVKATYERARLRASVALREAAGDRRFREAVTWQNRAVLRRAFDPLIATTADATDFRTRQRERLVASYIQRYCLKNESVGFFGPIGWGRVVDEGAAVSCVPGERLAGPIHAFLQPWAIEALGTALAKSPGIERWLAPRRLPIMRVEGTAARTPLGDLPLDALHARVLSACDGTSSAHRLAERLATSDESSDDVMSAIFSLEKQGLLRLALDVPSDMHPEAVLARDLAAIEDEPLRLDVLRSLHELTDARDAAETSSTPDELYAALDTLDETFVRLTGTAATRRAGETYAMRTVVFPVATRDCEVQIGPGLVDRLRGPMALLLSSARWLGAEIARVFAAEARRVFDAQASALGTDTVDAVTIFPAVASMIPRAGGTGNPRLAEIVCEYQRRWATILALPPDARVVRRSSAELDAKVRKMFPATTPAWPTARYHSPDVMIGASGPTALASGDYVVVLGELHTFTNTIEQLLFLRAHPDPDQIRAAIEHDMPHGRIAPVTFQSGVGMISTRNPQDVEIESDTMRSRRERSQVLAAADLVVCVTDGELAVRTRDARRCWSLLAVLDAMMCLCDTRLLPQADHSPRIEIDGVIIGREAWRFAADELPFIRDASPFDRYIAGRRWATRHDLPRYVFVRPSNEIKPFFVDFHSPTFVEHFAKLSANAVTLDVSEMLPTPEQAWLTDRDGHRYTSELRMVAVDASEYPRRRWER
jgi:hypothetical protein